MISTTVFPVSGDYVQLSDGILIGTGGYTTAMTSEIFGLIQSNILRNGTSGSVNPPLNLPSYVVTSLTSLLANERVLSGSGGITIADNGPGSTVVVDGSSIIITSTLCTSLNSTAGLFDKQVVVCDGYTTRNDGGGGTFTWNAASTSSLDNGTVFGNVSKPGRWLRQWNGSNVTPEWFGAKGDGTTNDATAIASACSVGTVVDFNSAIYGVSTPLTFSARKTFRGRGEKATYIKALATMSAVGIGTGDDATFTGLSFNANHLALDAYKLSGSNGATFTGCSFESAKRHGFNAGLGNNNSVTLLKCNARFNGTTLTTGTVAMTYANATITFSTPLDLSTVEKYGLLMTVPGVTPNGGSAGDPFIIDKFTNSTTATVTFVPLSTNPTASYTLYSGNGYNEAYDDSGPGGNDNNVWGFYDCYAVGNAKAGFRINSLYGPMMSNCIVDSSYCGIHIGTRSATNSVSPIGTHTLRFYSEGNTRDIIVETSAGTLITDPVSTVPVWAPDSIGYAAVTLIQNGAVKSSDRINEAVNASTLNLMTSENFMFVQSAGAGNITVNLPVAADVDQVFPQRFSFASADLGGKTISFKTLSAGTLVNGVAGTTGITVSGSYSAWNARWSANLSTWVVK